MQNNLSTIFSVFSTNVKYFFEFRAVFLPLVLGWYYALLLTGRTGRPYDFPGAVTITPDPAHLRTPSELTALTATDSSSPFLSLSPGRTASVPSTVRDAGVWPGSTPYSTI